MSAAGRYLLFLAVLAAVTAGLVGVGYLWAAPPADPVGLRAILLACGVSFAGSAVGGLPIALARSGGAEGVKLFLLSMVIRLVVVALLAAAVVFVLEPPRVTFLVWLGASYLVLLVADSGYAWSTLRSL